MEFAILAESQTLKREDFVHLFTAGLKDTGFAQIPRRLKCMMNEVKDASALLVLALSLFQRRKDASPLGTSWRDICKRPTARVFQRLSLCSMIWDYA